MSVKADVIVLGCTLPGIVAAYKLKSKFGDTMDVVVLDFHGRSKKPYSQQNVGFAESYDDSDSDSQTSTGFTAKQLLDNVTRLYLMQYAKEFELPLPDAIIYPDKEPDKPSVISDESDTDLAPQEELERIPLQKLFQYPNGSTVGFLNNVHDFEYLNCFEKFELNQYQARLDRTMKDLFFITGVEDDTNRTHTFLRYDRTTMETNICGALLFTTSREIMRIIVRLVCGAPASRVSLLFYLYQCFRTNSTKNHLGGLNTRFREKLLGHCKKRLSSKLRHSVADITLPAKPIKEIRTISKKVILETIKGEATYVCNLVAMALKPDQLDKIEIENRLLSEENKNITRGMTPGRAIKFNIQYEENFWSRQGYSGDIFSMRGPIIWAMERPILSTTGSLDKYSGLIGYLMVHDDRDGCKEAVLEQLVNMFGSEAACPVSYIETPLTDVYIPRCGDYVALRRWTTKGHSEYLEWGALDIYADGDLGSALEAGHSTYLHVMACLRPQAQEYDDFIVCELPIHNENTFFSLLSRINFMNSFRITVCAAALWISVKLLRLYRSK